MDSIDDLGDGLGVAKMRQWSLLRGLWSYIIGWVSLRDLCVRSDLKGCGSCGDEPTSWYKCYA